MGRYTPYGRLQVWHVLTCFGACFNVQRFVAFPFSELCVCYVIYFILTFMPEIKSTTTTTSLWVIPEKHNLLRWISSSLKWALHINAFLDSTFSLKWLLWGDRSWYRSFSMFSRHSFVSQPLALIPDGKAYRKTSGVLSVLSQWGTQQKFPFPNFFFGLELLQLIM